MNQLWRLLNINNWSIRTKLTVIILLLVIAPTFLTLILVNAGAQIRDEENVERYLQSYGQTELTHITQGLDQVHGLLSGLASDLRYRRTVLELLVNPANLDNRQTIVDLLNNRLTLTGYFLRVSLADPEGNIIASTQQNLSIGSGINLAESFGFQSGQDAALLNEESRDTLYVDLQGNPVYEITQVIYYTDRSPAGFMIATLNIDHLLHDYLGVIDDFIPVVSYLTTSDGVVIAPPESRALAQESRQRLGLTSSLDLREGVYSFMEEDDQYTHFLSPIEGSRMVFVAENYDEIEINAPIQAFVESNGPVYIIVLMFFIGLLTFGLYNNLIPPLFAIRDAMLRLGEGDFTAQVTGVDRHDEIGTLARGIVSVRQQVLQTIDDLEQRLADRVRDLQATQEVSRYAATQRDLQRLMTDVVNLIVNSFSNIYHAQIFLIDADGRYAVLRASTGQAGETLLRRGHRLAVGSTSIIGMVTGEGRVIVERDTTTSTVHRANEFLPETRSELAIPLRIGNTIIGALDVQSKQDNTFFEDQVTLLQIMADQLAISVDNARLYQDSLSQLERLNKTSQTQTYEGWREHMRNQRRNVLTARSGNIALNTENLRQQALQTGEMAVGELTAANTVPVVVPVRLRGQILGVVEWELPQVDFNYEKLLLAEELVNRLAVSLDNARLFEESQRTVERERVVNSITAKFSTQTDIDQILQTAVREVGQVLHVPEVNIRLTLGAAGGSMTDDIGFDDLIGIPGGLSGGPNLNLPTGQAANQAANGNSKNGHHAGHTSDDSTGPNPPDDSGAGSSPADAPDPSQK